MPYNHKNMATEIQGYQFDGDPDGLKFIGRLDWDELQTIIYCVDNKGKAKMQDNYGNHLEITKSSEGVYMISKVAAASSSWF